MLQVSAQETVALDDAKRQRRVRSAKLQPRAIFWQLLVLLLVLGAGYWLVSNTLTNLELRRINSGFGFLERPASMPIGEMLIDYQPGDSNLRAIMVGLLNTVLVSVLGIILATILGLIVGISRLSKNWLLARLATVYVEFVRNVPLLAHLMLIYVLLQGLPPLRSAISVGDFVFLSNRGLVIPAIQFNGNWTWLLTALGAAIALVFGLVRYADRQQAQTGRRPKIGPLAFGGFIVLSALALLLQDASLSATVPRLDGFNFIGGATLSPELTALVTGLVIYFGAFIAEIVRGGILAISQGQWEAGYAVGLRRGQILRLIIVPLALRLIIPPTTNQYLDLTKSSSLAIAIGYPDLVAVINGVITDTGQAIECVALIMAAFLIVSLSISMLMNWYNARIALVER